MKKRNWKIRVGLFLIIFCIPFFLFIPAIPFLDMEAKSKMILSTISLVIGEILFWGGGILLGKELFIKYKSYFNPKNWFKKADKESE